MSRTQGKQSGAAKEETKLNARTAFVNTAPEYGRLEIVVQVVNYG